MNEKIVVIHNAETGEIIERSATEQELAQMEKDKIEAAQRDKQREAKAAARQAILDRLGLSEEEARLLLG